MDILESRPAPRWRIEKVVKGGAEIEIRVRPCSHCGSTAKARYRVIRLNIEQWGLWCEIKSSVEELGVRQMRLRELLRAAGANIDPSKVGWPETPARHGMTHVVAPIGVSNEYNYQTYRPMRRAV